MHELDPQICRNARLARDPRFDGQFFLAVTSTGIYCRPICPARPPRERNVRYYRTAAQAAREGFRPCLRCRPESAPNSPAWRGTSTTLGRALDLIQAGALNECGVSELSERLGIGERYLRKLFQQELGVSPAAVAQTQRLHFAQKLLAETKMPISEIAYASGYGSLRRFNSALKDAFQCTPREVRQQRSLAPGASFSLELSYRPPLDWRGLINFLGRHAIEGLEGVEEDCYWRRLEAGKKQSMLKVEHLESRHSLRLTLSETSAEQLMPLVAKVRRMFDLDATPQDIDDAFKHSPLFSRLSRQHPGVRSPVHWTLFEASVRAVVGQQVSLAAARSVLGKLVRACSEFSSDDPEVFPGPETLIQLPDDALPMPTARKATLRSVCQWFIDRDKQELMEVDSLAELKGIGPWTMAMVKMRGLADPDVFPQGDLGLIQAVEPHGYDRQSINAELSNCRPWRAYAANLLWRSLS